MDTNECPGKFMKNLAEMNRILKYFPFDDEQREITEPIESLDEDELIEIADHAKDPQWEVTMAKQNKKPWEFKSLTEKATFFKGLYASNELQDCLDNMLRSLLLKNAQRVGKGSALVKKTIVTSEIRWLRRSYASTKVAVKPTRLKNAGTIPKIRTSAPNSGRNQVRCPSLLPLVTITMMCREPLRMIRNDDV
jgi:hypothetical protein